MLRNLSACVTAPDVPKITLFSLFAPALKRAEQQCGGAGADEGGPAEPRRVQRGFVGAYCPTHVEAAEPARLFSHGECVRSWHEIHFGGRGRRA